MRIIITAWPPVPKKTRPGATATSQSDWRFDTVVECERRTRRRSWADDVDTEALLMTSDNKFLHRPQRLSVLGLAKAFPKEQVEINI